MSKYHETSWALLAGALIVSCTTTPEHHAPPAHEEAEVDIKTVTDLTVPIVKVARAKRQWPPPALAPLPFIDADPDEGKWKEIKAPGEAAPGASAVMYQARLHNRKLRGPKRNRFNKRDRLYEIEVFAWDPEQLHLKFVAGFNEPAAPQKKRGEGRIPRDRQTLGRLVAAFNGGWRTKDTPTSGFMVKKKVGLPPGAQLATVGMYNDGRVELGTWEDPSKIPADMDSFRQNTQPFFDETGYNPHKRVQKWGGTGGVAGADGPYTVRSGLCRAEGGHLIYIYGEQMDHIQLAQTMERAHCEYGIHLDMNGIHAGFEFLELTNFKENKKGRLGFDIDARRLTKRMYYKPFPRYLKRRPKDIFYLVSNPVLPSEVNSMALKPLPQPGQSRFHPAAAAGQSDDVRLIILDTRRLLPTAPGKRNPTEGGLQILLNSGISKGQESLTLRQDKNGDLTTETGEGPALVKTLPLSLASTKAIGLQGPFVALLEVRGKQKLKDAIESMGQYQWLGLGDRATLSVRTKCGEGQRWVEYDGFDDRAEPIKETTAVEAGTLGFGLNEERAMVGDLFDGPGEK